MITFTHLEKSLNPCNISSLPLPKTVCIDAKGLALLPAGTDEHVHSRTPGHEYKENWLSGRKAAFKSGFTRVFDMPNTFPSCITKERFFEKKERIQNQLKNHPLDFGLYMGASSLHLEELEKTAHDAIGIKVFMGSSTGDLLLSKEKDLEKVFQIAKKWDLLIAVHAEDENRIQKRKKQFPGKDPSLHSKIRDDIAAENACKIATHLAIKYQVRLLLLHISTKKELEIIRKAKKLFPLIYAEACPHHLFFDTSHYQTFGQKLLINPPIRKREDRLSLIEALKDGTIDTVGSDHAPHLLKEKEGQNPPSGVPGIDAIFPVLFALQQKGEISLKKIVQLTSKNQEKIFRLPKTTDYVLFNIRENAPFSPRSKCGWSPYSSYLFPGEPVCMMTEQTLFPLTKNAQSRIKEKALEHST